MKKRPVLITITVIIATLLLISKSRIESAKSIHEENTVLIDSAYNEILKEINSIKISPSHHIVNVRYSNKEKLLFSYSCEIKRPNKMAKDSYEIHIQIKKGFDVIERISWKSKIYLTLREEKAINNHLENILESKRKIELKVNNLYETIEDNSILKLSYEGYKYIIERNGDSIGCNFLICGIDNYQLFLSIERKKDGSYRYNNHGFTLKTVDISLRNIIIAKTKKNELKDKLL